MTLFEIDKAIMEFELDIDEETGEVLNAEELDNLQMEREKKIENVGLWYKNLVAEAEMIKAEKNAMAERQKRIENKAESLKKYLAYALNGEKFEKPRVAMSFRKSKSVNILDEASLDDKWCNISVVRKPDKTAIKKAIDGGEEVKGAEIVEKLNISIK